MCKPLHESAHLTSPRNHAWRSADSRSIARVWNLETGELVAFHAPGSTVEQIPVLRVNHPRSLIVRATADLSETNSALRDAPEHPLVLLITDDALTGDPVKVLKSVSTLRALGWAIAVESPGADTMTMALLPLINPDMISFDLRELAGLNSEDAEDFVHALGAHAENADCVVLARGIDTDRDVIRARAYGATLGEGTFLDSIQPAAQPLPRVTGIRARPIRDHTAALNDTPYTILSERRESRAGALNLLLELSDLLERRAHRARSAAVVLSTFQNAHNVTPAMVQKYDALAQSAALVALFAQDLEAPAHPISFATSTIEPADDLAREWNVIVIAPHFSAVLSARQEDAMGNGSGSFEFIFSRDRRLAVDAARTLVARL
jgi:EAL domain-containing protein (putative c-di-GMP-specific phosphodiesterase class I)